MRLTDNRVRGRWLIVGALVAVTETTGGTAHASTTATTTAYPQPTITVTDVSLSTHELAVAGIDVSGALTVSAHVTSTLPIVVGQTGCSAGAPTAPWATLTSGDRWMGVSFALTAGSTTDGTWTATVPVTTGWAGQWEVKGIGVQGAGGECQGPIFDWQPAAPADPAYRVQVMATNAVQVTFRVTPDPVPWAGAPATMTGRVTLADGSPVVGKVVHTCQEGECLADGQTVTRSDGTFAPLPIAAGMINRYWVSDAYAGTFDNPAGFVLRTEVPPSTFAVRLTARANVGRISLGRYVDISGWIGQVPIAYCNTLRVQRYVSGTWRDVPATARVSSSWVPRTVDGMQVIVSDYRFHVRTVARGNVRYRVHVPAQSCDVFNAILPYTAGTSPAVIVRVW